MPQGGGVVDPPPSCMTGTCPGWTVVVSVGKSPSPYFLFRLKTEGGKEIGRHKMMRAGRAPYL